MTPTSHRPAPKKLLFRSLSADSISFSQMTCYLCNFDLPVTPPSPQPFDIMIRIPFDTERISHAHLVHPLELAHLIHFWDNRQDIQRDQHEALTTISEQLRRLAPLVAELINRSQPDHPFQHVVPQIANIMTQFREELNARLEDTDHVLDPIPTPHIPYDACGRMRGPQDCYPAPILRHHVYPRSRSAPPTIQRKRQHLPWVHLETVNYPSVHRG